MGIYIAQALNLLIQGSLSDSHHTNFKTFFHFPYLFLKGVMSHLHVYKDSLVSPFNYVSPTAGNFYLAPTHKGWRPDPDPDSSEFC